MKVSFIELEKAFDALVDQGFNPVGYTTQGRTLVVYDPADSFKELYTVPSEKPLDQAMETLEADLKQHLLDTKQYVHIKRHWVSKLPKYKKRNAIEFIDDVDHTCLACNKTIPAWYTYWVFDLNKKQMDEPERDYLVYCDECVQEQIHQQKVDDLLKSDDEEWKKDE